MAGVGHRYMGAIGQEGDKAICVLRAEGGALFSADYKRRTLDMPTFVCQFVQTSLHLNQIKLCLLYTSPSPRDV